MSSARESHNRRDRPGAGQRRRGSCKNDCAAPAWRRCHVRRRPNRRSPKCAFLIESSSAYCSFSSASVVLWYGSPARNPLAETDMLYPAVFVLLFAIGFIVGAMGLMGAEKDYPALLSGLVLYFIVGVLIAVIVYVRHEGIGGWTLRDADDPTFWIHTGQVVAGWPYELVRMAGIFGLWPDLIDIRRSVDGHRTTRYTPPPMSLGRAFGLSGSCLAKRRSIFCTRPLALNTAVLNTAISLAISIPMSVPISVMWRLIA
jgi:hypothetical protein